MLKLYSNKTAPSPRRARMLLSEKGLEFELIEVDLAGGEQLTPTYLAKVPAGLVPALEVESGEIITENLGIAAYLEAAFPDRPMLGSTALEKGRVAQWNARVEYLGLLSVQDAFRNKVSGLADRALPGPTNYAQIPALAQRGLERINEFMDTLNERLKQSLYVAGDFYSLADITATVVVDFAGWVRVPIPATATALAHWHERMQQRESYTA
ncbi:glutathione S-transferase [Exilibacterium tricleocarpae]|uniref:Glutathione S-transferase n=1 Tax=Exilibacterium tricleocarpae TaxID=2591008 RepID=A0A545SPV6_9GAMM|nr:glutathione S-transferase [Exilibacterium tricleocarpae]TQV67010.1 glutathione S-transferase [Exilibacterium tricleocarpae]